MADLRDAIMHVPADDYGTWIAIGEALATLKSTDYRGDALELWLEVERHLGKFDDADARARWAGFKPRRTSHAAVFAEAERCGWVNPAQGPPAGQAHGGRKLLGTCARCRATR